MLKKEERFRRHEFDSCYRDGGRTTGTFLRLITLPSKKPKASVVVSKKVSMSAVVRNELRRKIYAILRDIPRRESVIVILFPNALHAPYSDVQKELHSLLRRSSR